LKKTAKQADEETNSKKSEKLLAENDPKILRLRKYLRLAGLFSFVKNADLNAMKTKTARYNYLKKIFIDAGFDGSLSIAACKKFKLKREQQKEIAELDVSNIINNDLSSSNNKRTTRNSLLQKKQKVNETNANINPFVKMNKINLEKLKESSESEDNGENQIESNNNFSRIQDLIESDESSSDEKKKKKSHKKADKVIESDED
jgi:hypothetical protein